jgi:hypothetical protein
MIERCPSGSYTYALDEHSADIEPDLPQQVAVTTEMTSDGPIAGPLWVTGGMAIERADGKATEMTEKAKLFVEKLRNHVSIPVQTIDERFTTDMAEKLLRGIKHEERDQVSAQILLQNFLDSLSAAS